MKSTLLVLLAILFQSTVSLGAEAYRGSSFAEVLGVLQDEGYTPQSEIEQKEFAVYASQTLPQYPVSTWSIFSQGSAPLQRDAVRTVSERFDYYDRLAKRLHPNGVCVTGEWKIDAATNYSGYFAQGSRGLFVGRISVAMEETTSDDSRGFGIAGKVFPTMNPDEKVVTGNFFTVDVLMGTDLARVLDASTTNQPETGFKLSLIGMGLRIASALKTADNDPGFRPLTQVAALNSDGEVRQPKWIRLKADLATRRNNQKDFRHEVLQAMQENRQVNYSIEVSDTTHDRNASSGWNKIGEISLNHAVVSYGCDRRLHFAHPKLK